MIDLQPNCVAQYLMDDNRPTPWVVGPNGVPTERVKNGDFEDDSEWVWGTGWSWNDIGFYAHWQPSVGYGPLTQIIDSDSISGEEWAVFFEVKSGPGTVNLEVRLGGTLFGTITEKDKKYVFTGTAGGSNNYLQFIPTSGTGVKIDNVFGICLDDCPLTGVFFDAAGDPRTNAHSVAGKVNIALSFDGVDDHIVVLDEGALEFGSDTQDFSIAMCIRRERITFDSLLDKRDGVDDGWWLFFSGPNRLYFKLNSVATYTAEGIIVDTNWHLIMVIVNRDGNMQLYVDNVAVGAPANVSGQTMSIDNELWIGKERFGSQVHFKGDIDVTTFFNKALSQAERDFIWQNGRGTNALHEVLRPGFTSLIGKPRIEALSSSIPRMIATPSSKPRIESGIISP